MATDISTTIGVTITSTPSKTTVAAAPAGSTSRESVTTDSYTETNTETYDFGAGANKAKGHFHGTWSCGSAAQVVFDVNAAINDALGDQIVATEIKAIYLHNVSTTTGDLLEVLGDAAAGGITTRFTLAATDAVNLHPDGVLLLTSPIDGFAVAAGATDEIEIDNNTGGAISFEIFVLYEHA